MADFRVERSTTIQAPPALLHGLVDDFHHWQRWSPWEDLDPELQRTFTGPSSGVGSRYSWKGNRKAGEGAMEITSSTPERVDLALTFLRPMKATNLVAFDLRPTADGGTHVVWSMTGEQKGLMGLLGKLVPMDRWVGKDFEKGLARLKQVAESGG